MNATYAINRPTPKLEVEFQEILQVKSAHFRFRQGSATPIDRHTRGLFGSSNDGATDILTRRLYHG
ncbi:hypothetical protein DPMN_070193 [Dreissena polymorpha]|uniref:Uncharacterized protein n=1 Tax=Dreissena polymorpha TaxID=45954 RepID=A0A9D4BNQ4_DREPO|nr:hypothetical protein DPMN_070193 [Dreissena polymorpha]